MSSDGLNGFCHVGPLCDRGVDTGFRTGALRATDWYLLNEELEIALVRLFALLR